MQPAKFVLAAFGSVILLGAALLRLDISLEPGYSLSWVDAIFTATSATCVTGLVVTDTASTFSSFGEGIILLLIQIGALGITTMSTLFLLLLGERPSVQSEIIVEDTLGRMLSTSFTATCTILTGCRMRDCLPGLFTGYGSPCLNLN